MMRDKSLIRFWKRLPSGSLVHPDDRQILDKPLCKHGFKLACVPIPYTGRLLTAPVVIAYLNPGWRKRIDRAIADDPERRARVLARMTGTRPVPIGREGSGWHERRLRQIGDPEDLRDKVAFINLVPYHSKSFRASKLVNCLPSTIEARRFMHEILVPEARSGRLFLVSAGRGPSGACIPRSRVRRSGSS